MHPISYVKAHPVATLITAALGMAIGPSLLSMVGSKTGVNVTIPQYGNGG